MGFIQSFAITLNTHSVSSYHQSDVDCFVGVIFVVYQLVQVVPVAQRDL